MMLAFMPGGDHLALVHGVAMLALVTLTYGFMIRAPASVLSRGIAIGLTFGSGAVLAMVDPLKIDPGIILDGRGVILVLVGAFGGPLAAGVASACALVYRIWLGGAGMPVGVLTIMAAAATGVIFANFVPRIQGGYDMKRLSALAAVGSVHSIFLALVPLFVTGSSILATIPLHMIMNFLGILVLGHFLSSEENRRHAIRLLQREAETDPLTGLLNRRVLDRSTEVLFDHCRRAGRPVSLLMIDVDRFKVINDRWGHSVGDRMLRQVADTVRANSRSNDIIARYGGEEIVMLMPDASGNFAVEIAERIRSAIDTDVFHLSRDIANVTVSIGVATACENHDFGKLFVEADSAVYRAKAFGRNQVIPFSGLLPAAA
ncbi:MULTISPECIES: GGDEF domain-containing protein [Jiella]|uniref:diguanylate cyclase n=2 Tax=Jiella TaxID=1775688 RepID=A0A6N9T945_9HYPH|nr:MULTISPECIES: diguanylate cyclase [Jiella]NDW07964.1 diguanylate cyclase [Jiella pacifica]WAP66830.1 diguanylate cyclase [Jiella pelagia]